MKKEYNEMKGKQPDETDEKYAHGFWECNLRRNEYSIFTFLFYWI